MLVLGNCRQIVQFQLDLLRSTHECSYIQGECRSRVMSGLLVKNINFALGTFANAVNLIFFRDSVNTEELPIIGWNWYMGGGVEVVRICALNIQWVVR